MNTGYDIGSTARLSNLTTTMVDYLCRTKIVIPSVPGKRGRGRPRVYSFGDVIVLRAISKLLKAGVSVGRLGKAFRSLRKHHDDFTPTNIASVFIVTDGRDVYLRRSDEVLECLSDGQMSFAFIVEVEKLRGEVLEQLEREPLAA